MVCGVLPSKVVPLAAPEPKLSKVSALDVLEEIVVLSPNAIVFPLIIIALLAKSVFGIVGLKVKDVPESLA